MAWTTIGLSPYAWAGAWPTPVGQGQIITTTLSDSANSGYNDVGNLRADVFFSKTEGAVYWEHGLSPTTTLVLQSSMQDIQFKAGEDIVDFSGVGESYIGLRHVLQKWDNTIFSAQAGVLFAGSGESISDADLGVGATQFEGRLLLGHSFKLAHKDGFLDIQGAYRMRGDTVPDEWRLDVTTGWAPRDNFQILTQGFYTSGGAKFEVSRANKRLKLQSSVVYRHSPKTSYQIGFYETVAGRNIVKEKAFFIAIWSRY